MTTRVKPCCEDDFGVRGVGEEGRESAKEGGMEWGVPDEVGAED